MSAFNNTNTTSSGLDGRTVNATGVPGQTGLQNQGQAGLHQQAGHAGIHQQGQPGQLNEHHGIAATGLNDPVKPVANVTGAPMLDATGRPHADNKIHNDHHLGRDAAAVGGAAGAAGLGHHEHNKHHDNLTGQHNTTGLTGQHNTTGLTGQHNTTGLTGQHNTTGLTGQHNTTGLTGHNDHHNTTGLTGQHNTTGLTGQHNTTGLTGQHNTTGLTGQHNTTGLTGHNDHHNTTGLTGQHNTTGLTGQHNTTTHNANPLHKDHHTALAGDNNNPITGHNNNLTGESHTLSGFPVNKNTAAAGATGAGLGNHEHNKHATGLEGTHAALGGMPTDSNKHHHLGGEANKDHHVGRDAAVGAGTAGVAHHELKDHGKTHNKDHHVGRDTAATGGVAGLAAHEHNKHDGINTTTAHHDGERHAGVPQHPGMLPAKNDKHDVDGENKPSAGDKIKGNLEKIVGKVTGNEAKVIKGENIAHGNAA